MGTYLSTPVTEKGVESGECLSDEISPLVWSVVDMQGWRKSMEDAHVADTSVPVPRHMILHAQHGADHEHAKVFGVFDGHGGSEVARFCQLYLVDVLCKQEEWQLDTHPKNDARDPATTLVGLALVKTFHALDRMIDDRSRRDELIRLRSEKPQPGEKRNTPSIPPEKPVHCLGPVENVPTAQAVVKHDQNNATTDTASQEHATNEIVDKFKGQQQEADPAEEAEQRQELDEESTDSVGFEEAAVLDRDEDDLDAPDKDELEDSGEFEFSEDAIEDLAHELHDHGVLVMTEEKTNSTSDVKTTEAAIQPKDSNDMQLESNIGAQQKEKTEPAEKSQPVATKTATSTAPVSNIIPTIIQNGRQICNLPDHPIHAGCTAIVAVLIGRTLTVANAGDSRAVLCRAGGRAEPLSFDHKPNQDREMARIGKAGGFVNQFGRVNGNLNLSRSIGDLKYKQMPGLTPAEQMITAEPDILQVTLHPKDEFIILGCDGIWDCLSNDQAVKFVRDRIDTKTPTEIGTEMLDEIISEDPRATQGIGGDNMTVMIVDLQPSTRTYCS